MEINNNKEFLRKGKKNRIFNLTAENNEKIGLILREKMKKSWKKKKGA